MSVLDAGHLNVSRGYVPLSQELVKLLLSSRIILQSEVWRILTQKFIGLTIFIIINLLSQLFLSLRILLDNFLFRLWVLALPVK